MTQKVLAIDDSPDIHQLLRVRLKHLDIQLTAAFNEEEAMRSIEASSPDLILLDVQMPGTNGFDLCRRLKSQVTSTNIPVIFLTASTDVEQKVLGFEVGAVDYIAKPFDPAELNARVRAALRTKRYFDMLSHRAMIDGLTGLWNRAHFDQRLIEEVASSLRYNRPLSLVMVDVDKFKSINDSHGHPFGDEVLQSVGDVLAQSARATDIACRYGGEEFALVLRETDIAGATVFAERLRCRLEALTLKSKNQLVPVTASFGISGMEQCMNPVAFSRQWLIESADTALYEAKHSGRNRVCVAKPA
jgi:two-component system cell cycle response regulator